MSVNGVTGASDVYSTYSAPSKSTEVKSETAAANTAADTGVVYEPSQEAKAASAKKYTPDANLIAKLKADSEARTAQFKSLVEQMLTKQGMEHTMFISGGGHTWTNWRYYLNNFVPLLFK